VRFIAEHKDRTDGGLRWGVESICRVLSEHGAAIAPSTYYEAASRPPSKRALRVDALRAEIARVHETNYGVYGPRKVWLALNREGIPVARCTVERLTREMALAGAPHGKRVTTAASGRAALQPRRHRIAPREHPATREQRPCLLGSSYSRASVSSSSCQRSHAAWRVTARAPAISVHDSAAGTKGRSVWSHFCLISRTHLSVYSNSCCHC